MSTHTDRDRNLLFGVFAVQLRKVTPSQIMEAAGAWATDPSKDLSTRLSEQGAISPADREFLDRMVSEAIRVHGGDAARTLQALGGAEMVADSFHRSIVLGSDGLVTRAEMGLTLLRLEDPILLKGVDEAPGRYTCESEHARGGMGRVLLVHDEFLGREIALKELLPDPHGDSGRRTPTPVRRAVPLMARFLQEAQITGQLEHPSIVPVYELGHRVDGSLYYTMKLVRGRTLSTAFAEARTLEQRLQLLPHFVDMCQAIAYAHSRRVIHRDIKPGNVMVGEFGETVVLDWGLAKVVGKKDTHAEGLATTIRAVNAGDSAAIARVTDEEGSRAAAATTVRELHIGDFDTLAKTQYGQALGTPMYMPPEQAKGQIDQVDERSDVYSLGAVLYELLTGKPPFDGKDIHEILQHVMEDDPEPIAVSTSKAPPELAAIAARALDKDPEHRYQSAKELAEELQRFQSGALVSAYRYRLIDKIERYVRRHKGLVSTAAFAAVVIVVISGIYVTRITHANRMLDRSREEEAQARVRADHGAYIAALSVANNLSREGSLDRANSFLWSTPERERGWEWGYVLNAANPDFATFSGHTGAVTAATFNRDGTRILSLGADRTVRYWDVSSRRELGVGLGHSVNPSTTYWLRMSASPQDDIAATISANLDGTLRLWDLNSGKNLIVLGGVEKQQSSACALDLKRGRILAAGSTGYLWNLKTGQLIKELEGHESLVSAVSFDHSGRAFATGDSKGHVRLWNADDFSLRWTSEGGGQIQSLVFSPDEKLIVTVDWNGSMAALDADTGNTIYRLGESAAHSRSLLWFERLQAVLVPTPGGGIMLREAQTGKTLVEIGTHGVVAGVCALSPSEDLLGLGLIDGRLMVFETRSWNLVAETHGHADEVTSLQYSPDGRLLLSTSLDGKTRVWPADLSKDSRSETRITQGRRGGIGVSAKVGKMAFLDSDGMVELWDTSSRQKIRSLGASAFPPKAVALSPDGASLALGSRQNTAVVLDVKSGQIKTLLYGHNDSVTALEFSPDGQKITTGCGDGSVHLWDAKTGALLLKTTQSLGRITTLTLSPDGGLVAIGNLAGDVALWDLESRDEFRMPDPHIASVRALAFSPDGAYLLSGSDDGTSHFWRVSDRSTVRTLACYSRAVAGIAISPDGTRLLTASEDGEANIWDWRTGEELLNLKIGSGETVATAWLAGSDEIALANREGGITWLAPAPYKVDALPGSGADTWRKRFEAHKYNLSAAGRVSSALESPVPPMTVCASPDEVERRFRTLTEREPPIQDGPGALTLSEDRSVAALQPYGFREGDLIVQANGVSVTSLAALAGVYEPLLKNRDAASELAVTVRRGDSSQLIRIFVTPRKNIVEETTIAYDQAVVLLKFGLPLIATNISSLSQMQEGGHDLWDVPPKGSTFDGIWIASLEDIYSGKPVSQISQMYQKGIGLIGLKMMDKVVAIDGVRLASIDVVKSFGEQTLAKLLAQGSGDFHFEVLRGSFVRVDLHVTITP